MGSRVSEDINLYRTLGYIVCYEEDDSGKGHSLFIG